MLKRFLLVRGTGVLLFAALAAVPLAATSPYALGLLTLLAIYGIVLIGLDVTVGYLGQVNLAQAAFLGLGAYAAGIATTRFGLGMPASVLLAGALCTAVGALLALPALRLEGPQFALATLSFLALTTTALNELEWLTGGAQGLALRRPPLLGHTLSPAGFYWLCLALLALVWLAMRNLLSSQWGRAFEALRDSPIATDAMGVGTYRHKVAGFAFGSGLGGAAGALYAFNFQYLQPQSYVYDLTVILLLGVVLGGRKSLWGAVVGAALVALLPNLLSSRTLFQAFSGAGLAVALLAGFRGLAARSRRLVRDTVFPLAALGLLAAAGVHAAWHVTGFPREPLALRLLWAAAGLAAAAAGARWLMGATAWRFRELAPICALGALVGGGFLAQNTEDWRKAIFALLLFSVVVGLPEGLMGFAASALARLFRIPPAPLPPPAPLDQVLPPRATDGAPLLELRGLARHFGGVRAVDGVDLVVRAGTVHGLIGPNGSGKSTLVNVVSGLYTPSGGELLLRGAPLPRGSLFQAARAGVARTFQNLQLFGGMSTLENVMVALRGAYRLPLPLVLAGLGRGEERRAQAEALALLALVGLEGEARTPVKDLTYGAQRFLEIARALARKPELLVLDEPAAGLAHPDVVRQVEVVRRIHARGVTIVLIEHHMDVVTELCDTVTVLDGGRVIAEGRPELVKRDPRVVAAYLGSVEPDAGHGAGAGPGAGTGAGPGPGAGSAPAPAAG